MAEIKTLKAKETDGTEFDVYPRTVLGAITDTSTNNTLDNIISDINKDVTRTDTTSTAKPSHGGTFTAVKTVTSDAKGHVTGVDTETITLPSSGSGGGSSESKTLLWSTTKTSSFAKQTIILSDSMSNYDEIEIEYKLTYGFNGIKRIKELTRYIDNINLFEITCTISPLLLTHIRTISMENKTTLTIYGGYELSILGEDQDTSITALEHYNNCHMTFKKNDDVLIPKAIYGIKTS